MTAADVMQQAAACMDAAISAALEDARKNGFSADLMPSGEYSVYFAAALLQA